MLVEGSTAVREIVEVGIKEAGLVEITGKGLEEGMQVVTVGAYGLPDKTKIVIQENKNGLPDSKNRD
jgi:membrane fusion protein (multidrug efflux system)